MNFVVLSSSRGTVFEATLQRIKDGTLHAACLGVVSDRSDRGCIVVAKKYKMPFKVVQRMPEEDRESYDQRLNVALSNLVRASQADPSRAIVACMGWMRLLSPWFVREWNGRLLNVHPSLLPKHPGAHAHDLVLAAKDTESGMTIHVIDEGLDSGKTLVQKKCAVLPADTVDTLKTRVQALESEWFPKVLEMIETGALVL
jgi:formyltetrahydrofolate-dependent phosphoribosylglycinamide formyltransferase